MIFKKVVPTIFFLLTCLFITSALRADISSSDLRSRFQLPSSEWVWVKGKDSHDFLNIDHKKLGKALNIAGRTDTIAFDAKTYLTEVRKLLPEDKKNYGDAQINLVETKNLFGKEWVAVKISAPDGLKQEMWSRKISTTQVLLLLYTGIGEPFDQYHGDFDKILERASSL